jgi:epoxyqueuosine reductase
MKEAIRRRAMELGFDDCRFTNADAPDHATAFQEWLDAKRHGEMAYLERNAAKRKDPQRVLPGASSVIALAASYEAGGESHGPRESGGARVRGIVGRYARHSDYHDVLEGRLKALAGVVDELGGDGCRSLWYVDTGPVLERDLAQRAGLGFIGKHTNLISRRFGNWLFLAEILTTLKIEPDEAERNHCGTCSRCLSACPTAAIRAPFQLDARRCISYLTIEARGPIPVELRRAMGSRIYGCDDCLEVCPWNRFAREGRLMKEYRRPELGSPELLELLRLDDAEFKRRFAGTAILRGRRRGLLRNVCVALGNAGDASALPELRKRAAEPEPLIAEHAQWAIAEIEGRRERPSSGARQR